MSKFNTIFVVDGITFKGERNPLQQLNNKKK